MVSMDEKEASETDAVTITIATASVGLPLTWKTVIWPNRKTSTSTRTDVCPRRSHASPATPAPPSASTSYMSKNSADDPALPLNFPSHKKWLIIFLLASMTFMTPFASSILAPSIGFMDSEFGNDSLTMGSLAVSIYLLGYAVGPLFLAGQSEIYGRHTGCALAPSLGALIGFRFLSGIGGSACLTLGGGYVSDLVRLDVEERGQALSVWTVGPLIGPTIGPLVGAWLGQTIGWRWSFWIVLIPRTLNTIVIAMFSCETSDRIIIQNKLRRLSKQLGRTDLRSCYEDLDAVPVPRKTILAHGLMRPLKMLCLSPTIFILSLYIAFAYGVLYLLFNTIPKVFQDGYGWSIGITGLVYIPLDLGADGRSYVLGLFVFAHMSDRTVLRLNRKNNGVFEPEMRLVDCIYFACCLPVTFFWYGWSASYRVHWIVPVLGLFPYGFAMLGIWQPLQAYMIDSNGYYAASGMAAFTVLRSVVAAFLPLAGPSMYETLGLGWGNSLLGFICVILIPVPLLMYRHGKALRQKFPLKLA
ncbi:major facilitator superfamily transporter multidrug resistance [Grosmannia clavigera kw1407]|uniref:Major facilitator superfamily transporter multidrug resistance n=1 Tax=Grosmannia clavigera (strain kw1407 / UAMH 11150) TaxID=655863 RepID=F0XFJ5_GROCL|nr:major facilitator superfamily transporter multidrug resistance [Grosmannia clavigera kw1407]EFX03664.1 major facilitator superfamily transporter multidrug resistance [Grosmannia clavigera kw1407]